MVVKQKGYKFDEVVSADRSTIARRLTHADEVHRPIDEAGVLSNPRRNFVLRKQRLQSLRMGSKALVKRLHGSWWQGERDKEHSSPCRDRLILKLGTCAAPSSPRRT